MSRSIGIAAALSLTVLSQAGIADDNWPQFRGPGARGVSENPNVPDIWSATENVAWTASIPGHGWSSPIVWGTRVFVTTVVSSGTVEEAKKGLYFGGDRANVPQDEHVWLVRCIDLTSGETVWEKEVHRGPPRTPLHIKNTYASETPVTDGERVYAYFGNVGLFCFDMEGNLQWQRDWPVHRMRANWGTAASPALHGDRLYIVNDNEEQSFLEALDKRTGKTVWQVPRDEKSNWSTPFVWENEQRTEIITPGTGKSRAYDLEGALLYEFNGASSITIATPYAAHGLLYVSSGFILDPKRPVFAIRPGASGDLSLAANETSNAGIAWCQKLAAPYNPSTIVYGDLLYVLLDRGFVACYDAKTGEQKYAPQRIAGGQAYTASPWANNGKVFFLSEYGQTSVVAAAPEFKLLHTNALADDDMCMATPALAGGRLLIRADRRLYCISGSDVKAEAAAR
jgi:outer membrane protein assembly factor BamB